MLALKFSTRWSGLSIYLIKVKTKLVPPLDVIFLQRMRPKRPSMQSEFDHPAPRLERKKTSRKAHEYMKCAGEANVFCRKVNAWDQRLTAMLVKLTPSPSITLRQMESTLSFLNCGVHTTFHNVQIAVIGQFEIIDTGHDTREVVVWRVRWLAGLANHSEHWSQALESCSAC